MPPKRKVEEESELMCLSDAKRTYRLTNAQLSTMEPAQLARNPHGRNAAPVRLYHTRDLLQASIERHGSFEALLVYKEKLAERKQRKAEAKHAKNGRRDELIDAGISLDHEECRKFIASGKPTLEECRVVDVGSKRIQAERKEALKIALTAVGVTFRTDSHFCDVFVRTGEPSIETVVQAMCQAHWIHAYHALELTRAISDIRDEDRDFRREFGYREDNDFNDEERKETFRKRMNESVLRQSFISGEFPPHWPWQIGIDVGEWRKRVEELRPRMKQMSNEVRWKAITEPSIVNQI